MPRNPATRRSEVAQRRKSSGSPRRSRSPRESGRRDRFRSSWEGRLNVSGAWERSRGNRGEVCFAHNPAENRYCRKDGCVRRHLDTGKQALMEIYKDAVRVKKWEDRSGPCSVSSSPSPKRRCRGRSSSSESSPQKTRGCSRSTAKRARSPGQGGKLMKENLQSFFKFMQSQPDDVTPEKAIEAFKAHADLHRSEQAMEFFERQKANGLLADAYRGIHLLRAYDWRVISTQRASASFVAKLKSGVFEGLSLTIPEAELQEVDTNPGALASTKLTTKPNTKPHFLAETHECSMVFQSSDAALSIWDFHEVFQEQPGFLDAQLEKPVQQTVRREGCAWFQSEAELEAAMQQLQGANVKGQALELSRTLSKEPLRVLLAPAAASTPSHILASSRLALGLLGLLDGAVGLPQKETAAALEEASKNSAEALLDMSILYLRCVHNFCFYSLVQCKDRREFHRRCGVGCLRVQDPEPIRDDAWPQEHLRGLRQLLRTASPTLVRPDPLPASESESRIRSRWEATLEESMKLEAEGRHRCLKCAKLFKAREFLQKHILKTHYQDFCRLVLELRDDQMKEAFLKDPIHLENGEVQL